jgi:hypothetical protein
MKKADKGIRSKLKHLGYLLLNGFLYNLLPRRIRDSRLSILPRIRSGKDIQGLFLAPTPRFLEFSKEISLKHLIAFPNKYIFLDHGFNSPSVFCHKSSILTGKSRYFGKERPEKVITLSVDVEGGVALSHAPREKWDYFRKLWDVRESLGKLALLFEKYELPVTWAFCGHLFLEECNGKHGYNEEDWFGDWFSYDPGDRTQKDSGWYLPDVIRYISQKPLFDIAYHSFGHFNYTECSEDTVHLDMAFARKLREEWGIKLDTFVFPYNRCGYFDLLLEEGEFRKFRGTIGSFYPPYGILDFGDFQFFHTTRVLSPMTLDLCSAHLDRAGKKTINFYTHDFQWLEQDAWDELDKWLRQLYDLREAGRVEIIRMDEIR